MDIDIVLKHDSPLRVQTPGQEFPVSPFADLPVCALYHLEVWL